MSTVEEIEREYVPTDDATGFVPFELAKHHAERLDAANAEIERLRLLAYFDTDKTWKRAYEITNAELATQQAKLEAARSRLQWIANHGEKVGGESCAGHATVWLKREGGGNG